jgi:CRISPR-associated exonuclease Cas4
MTINATLVNLYHICQRECWLHANGIRMETTSDIVADGKLLHETSYPQRPEKYSEIELSAMLNDNITLSGKIDFYDAKEKIIHEIKRSDKVEEAHTWQVKYYIWLLALNDIQNVKGILEYPKLRERQEIIFTETDAAYLKEVVMKIAGLINAEACPPNIHAKICKSCSYYELCYIAE